MLGKSFSPCFSESRVRGFGAPGTLSGTVPILASGNGSPEARLVQVCGLNDNSRKELVNGRGTCNDLILFESAHRCWFSVLTLGFSSQTKERLPRLPFCRCLSMRMELLLKTKQRMLAGDTSVLVSIIKDISI